MHLSDIIPLNSINLDGKKVLIRTDFNVPTQHGKIISDQRIVSTLPTIEYCLKQGAKVILMSHLGRPKAGCYDEDFSLKIVAEYLQKALKINVELIKDWQEREKIIAPSSSLTLLENVRFAYGEMENDDALGKKLADFCDVFVMDAFGSAHRAHSSTHAVAKHAPIACAGPLLMDELEALSQALLSPKRPLLALVGGAKVSTKLEVLLSLADKVDTLITGGGIANTFALANGQRVGQSLCETNLVDVAKQLNQKMHARGTSIPKIIDVVVASKLSDQVSAVMKPIEDVQSEDCIFDLGKQTIDTLCSLIKEAETIVWNGPVGVFEYAQFAQGSERIAHAIADSRAFSIAGGGDTLAAIEKFGVENGISYMSTGGGAFLEFLEGKILPAVAILTKGG